MDKNNITAMKFIDLSKHIANTKMEFVSLLYLANIPKEVDTANPILKRLIDVAQEVNEEYEFAMAIYDFK